MAETDFFEHNHIHTTPEGRHFRHGDGVEVDGEGNPLPAVDDAQTLSNLVGFVIRRYAARCDYTYPTAARTLAADCDDPAVRRTLLFLAGEFEAALARLEAQDE